MAAVDRAAPRLGVAGVTLMENAGRAVARAIIRRVAPCRTLVLCGPGNNGGNGYVIARHLAQEGWPVTVAALAEPNPGTDAAVMAAQWRGPRTEFTEQAAGRADLVIDAIFGAGLSRDIEESVSKVLSSAKRIVAVDVPSGLDGATGQPKGRVAPADFTVTFFRLKPGHLLLPGRELCGEIVLADIGMPAGVLLTDQVKTFANGPDLWDIPPLAMAGQKYTRGMLTVLAGSEMAGAARMASLGARRAGAGLLTIVVAGNGDVLRATEPGLIVTESPVDELLQDQRRKTWICGPGLGIDRARATLPQLIAAGRQIVADADALGACAGAPEKLRGVTIITPHGGEFAKLFGPVGQDKLAAVRAAARRIDAVVVLKGADTVIAAPDGRAAINHNAPPSLATAGSGDVLAGIIAGLLTQGMAPWSAAAAGVWLHGEAANLADPDSGGAGLIAEDLADGLRRALAALQRR
ncbi:NAD(P)H-hydrate dehydratase [Acidisoma cellulosilytica]|uniref:Bifunctional NAD(P)H-hydrate repair enzyme n=2 Tax=Acidisoma cellulosilyticum TaxID=2802395 RepID=A0A963Z3D1_9PROT|nr:NAD(P)H-hydrate dehydratase [Acidisoma cellulosilyticum]